MVLKCASCPVRSTSFCDVVPNCDLKAFAKKRTPIHYEPHQTIVCEGELATSIFNVVSGVVKLSRSLPDGRTHIIGFRLPGELFATSENDTYTSSAEAITQVGLCAFPRSFLTREVRDYPRLQTRLLSLSYRQLAASEDQILLLGRMTAREKVARFLCVYGRKPFCDDKKQLQRAQLPMNRIEIAGFLGLTVETVSRILSSLRRGGIITVGRTSHSIHVADVDALERVAGINYPGLNADHALAE
jgi:CRP/FNR family transcriptional regulator